uniref:Putative site-specific tyrosine recombinase n=1 Tax=viral metagenome TaxID=1070528 RepID=A0A6H1Z6I0_9ZZZZ
MIKILSPGEFKKLEGALGHLQIRDSAILALFMYCGLRVGEVCKLRFRDLIMEGGVFMEVHVPGSISKTGIGRPVPIPPMARFFIDDFIVNEYVPVGTGESSHFLFPGTGGRAHMSVHGVEQLVSRICLKVLHKHVMPHALRHTYATMVLKYSNIREVQILLGHKKLSSTEVYTHPTIQDLSKSVNKTFS